MILSYLYELYGFIKPYEGNNLKTNKKKVLYNEREWRYIPELVRDGAKGITHRLTKKEIKDFKNASDTVIAMKYPLKFKPEDIKYIIVQNDEEIIELCSRISNINNKYFSKINKKLLTTRIITTKKIIEDF